MNKSTPKTNTNKKTIKKTNVEYNKEMSLSVIKGTGKRSDRLKRYLEVSNLLKDIKQKPTTEDLKLGAVEFKKRIKSIEREIKYRNTNRTKAVTLAREYELKHSDEDAPSSRDDWVKELRNLRNKAKTASKIINYTVKLVWLHSGEPRPDRYFLIECMAKDRFRIANEQYQEWIKFFPTEEYVEVVDFVIKIGEKVSTSKWQDIPMRSSNPVEVCWEDKFNNPIFSNTVSTTNTCVIDIIEQIGLTRGCKKSIGDREKIIKDLDNLLNQSGMADFVNNDIIKSVLTLGVSPNILHEYCKIKNLRLYLFNEETDERLINNVSNDKNFNRNIKPIIGLSHNGHLYEVISDSFKQSFTNSCKDGLGGKFFFSEKVDKQIDILKQHPTIILEQEDYKPIENPEGVYILKSSEDMMTQYIFLLEKHNKKYKYKSNSHSIVFINGGDKFRFILNNNIDTIQPLIPISTGQEGFSQVYIPILEKYELSFHSMTSIFNTTELYTNIYDNLVRSAYNYTDPNGILKTDITIDKNKAYSNIISDDTILWLKSNISDIPKVYNKEILSKDSIYWVEYRVPLTGTSGVLSNILIDRTGYYIYDIVNQCIMDGHITKSDIKFVMKCSNSMTEPKISKVVKDLYTTYGNNAKNVVNSIVGVWGSTYKDTGKINISSNRDIVVQKDILQFYEYKTIEHVYKTDRDHSGNKYIITRCPNKVHNYQTNVLMNAQVIQKCRLMIYKMAKSVGGLLIGVKTDAIIVRNPTYIPPTDANDFNGWKLEKTKYKKPLSGTSGKILSSSNIKPNSRVIQPILQTQSVEVKFIDEYNTELSTKQIKDELEKGNVLLTGRGGCGKTQLAKALIKILENELSTVQVIAPTHIATTNFKESKPETVHSFLSIGYNGEKLASRSYDNVDYVVCDEVSMLDEKLISSLIALQHRYPKIKYLFLGDFKQLPPVNSVNENLSEIYKYITSSTFDLKIIKRSENDSPEGTLLYNKVIDSAMNGENIDYEFKTDNELKNNTHLCYTNAKRKSINKKLMDKYKKDDSVLMTIALKEDLRDIEKTEPISQDTYIYVGLPLMAYVSKHSKDNDGYHIRNGFRFTVKEVNEIGKSIILQDTNEQLLNIKLDVDFLKTFVPAYAMTIHKAQGQTISEDYTIHEWKKLYTALKYVSLSRARKLSQISIVF
jgi:energy-coupling factor transporter ATP-binding protein EcfA2